MADYHEFYNLGNNEKSPIIISQYINNLDLLNEFSFIFNEKAKSIILNSERNRFILPEQTKEPLRSYVQQGIALKKNKIFKFKLNAKNNSYLSLREIECIDHYLSGKVSSEIAASLNLSRRTVETHIENIKNKLNCRNMVVAKGGTVNESARLLNVKTSTIKTWRNNILSKLSAKSIAEAVFKGIQYGYLYPPP